MARTSLFISLVIFLLPQVGFSDALPIVEKVAAQPLLAHVKQVEEALEFLGEPLPPAAKQAIAAAAEAGDEAKLVRAVQDALDPYCLAGIEINPESRVKAVAGPAEPRLVEQGLAVVPHQGTQRRRRHCRTEGAKATTRCRWPTRAKGALADRWFDLNMYTSLPVSRTLSGLELEYRIIQLYSRDEGKRSAKISFNAGSGTQDIGFRGELTLLFTAAPSTPVTLGVLDEDGKPTTAGFVIRDRHGRVYSIAVQTAGRPTSPSSRRWSTAATARASAPSRRREYSFAVTAGRNTSLKRATSPVGDKPAKVDFKLKLPDRPVEARLVVGLTITSTAAGCAHYTKPTEGVLAADMIRHCEGEDLKVGCNLTWGPCFDFQKQFFTGQIDKVSQYPYLLRYDIEVSGFGSHKSEPTSACCD